MSLQGQNFSIERPRGLEEVSTDWRKAHVVPILEKKLKGKLLTGQPQFST